MVFINTTHPPETFFLTVEGSDKSDGPRMGCFDSSMVWEDRTSRLTSRWTPRGRGLTRGTTGFRYGPGKLKFEGDHSSESQNSKVTQRSFELSTYASQACPYCEDNWQKNANGSNINSEKVL